MRQEPMREANNRSFYCLLVEDGIVIQALFSGDKWKPPPPARVTVIRKRSYHFAKPSTRLTVPCTKYESTLTSMRQLVLYKVDQVLLLLLHLILIFNIGLGSSRWGRRCRGY